MNAVRVDLLGTGDAVGSGGRHQTCTAVTSSSACVLVDCGASALVAMRQHGFSPSAVDAILITHLHGDHYGGIPFFLIDARYVGGRTRPLVIAGPPGVEQRVRATAELMFPRLFDPQLPFELRFIENHAGEAQRIGAIQLTVFEVVHSSGAPAHALRLTQDGRVVAFSGDTAWTESLFEVARGADLFICECYAFEHTDAMHISYSTLAARRAEFMCRRLLLTHLSAEMLDRAPELEIEVASDGQRIEL